MGQKKEYARRILTIRNIVLVILAIPLVTFLFWYFSLHDPKLPEPPLKSLAATHNIALGIHALEDRLSNKFYPDIITGQYSFIVIDGEVHFSELHQSPDKFDFSKADKLVGFAQAHNMQLQMHHLVWGEKHWLPDWLKNGNYSKQQLLNIMHEHIYNAAGHYKGKVAEWTVVNEAFTRAQHIYGLHDWWADHIGDTSYIDQAFRWAHEADPSAKLLLNDFNNETENSVSDAEYTYVKKAISLGVPIDGIGMQMHIDASNPPPKEDIIKNMRRFAALGLPTYITEFDINTNTVKGSALYKSQLESTVAYDMVRACIESNACNSFGVFGVTDKEILLKQLTHSDSHGYLFDSRFRPKQDFYSFRQAWLEP